MVVNPTPTTTIGGICQAKPAVRTPKPIPLIPFAAAHHFRAGALLKCNQAPNKNKPVNAVARAFGTMRVNESKCIRATYTFPSRTLEEVAQVWSRKK
jgi:hypothetical protein